MVPTPGWIGPCTMRQQAVTEHVMMASERCDAHVHSEIEGPRALIGQNQETDITLECSYRVQSSGSAQNKALADQSTINYNLIEIKRKLAWP